MRQSVFDSVSESISVSESMSEDKLKCRYKRGFQSPWVLISVPPTAHSIHPVDMYTDAGATL